LRSCGDFNAEEIDMQAVSDLECRSSVYAVPRVRLCHEGLRDLAACAVAGDPAAAELVDADGEVCGRARCDAGRDPMPWHVQLGGVLSSRRWAAVPMGCGRGEDPQSAARAAIEDLRRQASSRARAAAVFSEFFVIF
jgi:hypothetical protein